MTRNLLAFFLASLAVSLCFFGFAMLSSRALSHRPVEVDIRSNLDVHDLVNAVESVHRQDVDIRARKPYDPTASIFGTPMLALGIMFITGLTLAFYKWICRWMGIEATI